MSVRCSSNSKNRWTHCLLNINNCYTFFAVVVQLFNLSLPSVLCLSRYVCNFFYFVSITLWNNSPSMRRRWAPLSFCIVLYFLVFWQLLVQPIELQLVIDPVAPCWGTLQLVFFWKGSVTDPIYPVEWGCSQVFFLPYPCSRPSTIIGRSCICYVQLLATADDHTNTTFSHFSIYM